MSENTTLERPQKLTDLQTRNDIINRLANNEPGTHIARSYDVDHSNISRIKKANEELIEQKKQELIQALPSVVQTVTKDIKANDKVSSKLHNSINELTVEQQIQLKKQLDRTNENILKVTGILQPQSFIKNQTNIQNNTNQTKISIEFQEYMDMKSNNRQVYDTKAVKVDSNDC